jgi:hypothetical protein
MYKILDKFPALKEYVLNFDSYGEQIIRLNTVIANIRHMLGWNCDPIFTKYIIDVEQSKNMHELSVYNNRNRNSKSILEIILKCMTHILWLVTEDALSSPSLIEEEEIYINLDSMKKTIYNYGKE